MTLTLPPLHLHASDASPRAASRFQRAACSLRACSPEASEKTSEVNGEGGRGASLLKRKRPTRLDIPMGEAAGMEVKAGGSDGRREVEVGGRRFSVFCKRGKRRLQMEDRHRAELDLLGDQQMAFFGIFDGHGGAKAAEFASKKMGELIVEEVMRGEGLEDSVRTGYLKTDEGFLREGSDGGTCCVTAFLRKGDLVVSNVGDCRAVLSRGGRAEAVTSDHKPSREDERERIESLGGYVDHFRGVCRLQGTLAVSRGIGDVNLKQWVIAEPETKTIPIRPDCEFLILASDGLWDKVSNQEAVDIARPICMDPELQSPLAACKKLADISSGRGSTDDISIMIIQLEHFV